MPPYKFTLEPVPDRKRGVPTRAYVRFDGKPTGLVVEGTVLLRQDETYSGFLLWISHDQDPAFDPYSSRDTLQLYLLSPAVTVLDVRCVASGYGRGALHDVFVTGDDVFQFAFGDGERWRLTVLKTPEFQIIRRAYEWWQTGPVSMHHTAYFARRYLDLDRVHVVEPRA